MTTDRRPALTDDLAAAARHRGDLTALAGAVCAAVRRAVPYEFACLATLDPSTGLISWAYKTAELATADEEWAALEYGEWDVNLFSDLASRDEPVAVLSITTEGRPETCRRFRDFLAPRFGFTDELRMVFRTQGLVWGAFSITRGAGEPAFTAADAKLLAGVQAQIAELIRDSVFSGERGTAQPAPGPAVLLVDGTDRVVNRTPAAVARISSSSHNQANFVASLSY